MHIQSVEKMLDTLHDKREILRKIDLPPGPKISENVLKMTKEELKLQSYGHNDVDENDPTGQISKLLAAKNSKSMLDSSGNSPRKDEKDAKGGKDDKDDSEDQSELGTIIPHPNYFYQLLSVTLQI